MLLRFCWIFIGCFLSMQVHAEEKSPETQFRHAVTWYRVARATENGYRAHERAEYLYQQVINSEVASTELKRKARMGLEQTTFRLDNAHDTYRRIFEPVWWMTKSDPTVEWYGDPYMLALGNAYAALEAHWEREIDPENHAVVALVSRNQQITTRVLDTDGETKPQDEVEYRLSLMRDELIGLADSTPAIVGVPDDLFPTSIDWTSNPTITPEQIRQIAEGVGTQGVVVVRAIIDDEIEASEQNLGIVRVSLTTDFWTIGEDAPYATLKSIGIGQDGAPRKSVGSLWVLVLFLGTLLGSQLYARRAKDAQPVAWWRAILVGAGCFLIGGFWVNIALTFAADYQMDWGQASFWLENEPLVLSIPYIPAFQWILIFGFVSLVGPMMLLVWAQSKAAVLLQAFVPDKYAQIPLFLPMMSAGVLGWMFLPMVIADPDHGFIQALPMVLMTQGIIFITLPSFTNVLDGVGDAGFNLTNVIAGMFGLGFLFSIGLYNELEWYSFAVAIPLASWIQFRTPTVPESRSETVTLSTDTNNPFDQVRLIEKEEAVVDGVLNAIANTQSALIRRESGITAGRIFQRVVLDSVSNEEQMIHIECNSVDQEPFVVINRIFELLGWRSEASASGGDNLLADGVDSILTGLPGVEFVMGLIDNTGDSDMTREVMIEDAAQFMVRHLNTKVTLVLCLENAHWMDSASQEVLLTAIQQVDASMLLLVWDSSAEDSLELNGLRQSEVDVSCYESDVLGYTEDDIKHFISEYQVELPPETNNLMIRQIFDLSGKNIQKVQGLFAHLFDNDFLVKTEDGKIIDSDKLKAASNLKTVLPSSYHVVEQAKLEHFTESQATLLKLASACGDVFYAGELAAGLNQSKLSVLQDLMLIEQAMTPSIIVDVPNARNIFQFRLSLTQQVFEDYLYYDGAVSNLGYRMPNELAHHYFKQIVEAGVQNEIPEVPVSRLIEHASKLGNAALQSLLILMVRHFEDLKSMCALEDIIEEYEKFRPKFQPFASSFEVVQLDVMYADALKKTDRQNGQIRANEILNTARKMMRYLSEHQTFAFIKDWCDIGYAGVNDQDILAVWKGQVLEEVPNLPDISKWYVESYLLTTDRYLLRKDIAAELAVLVEQLRRNEKSLEQQYALGRILKETAVASWQEWDRANPDSSLEEQRSFFNIEIQPMFTEAIELMRTQNDFAGVAIAYGQEGDIHLNRLRQYPRAIELFEKDLDIVLEYHQINVESPTHNRLSTSYLGHWKEQWTVVSQQTAPDENWTKALENVESAIRVAKQREQSLNLIFALNHLTAVMMSREVLRASVRDQKEYASYEEARVGTQVSWKSLLTDIEEISEDILSIDWTMIRNDKFRSFLQGPWVAICADCPDVEWLQKLNQKLV